MHTRFTPIAAAIVLLWALPSAAQLTKAYQNKLSSYQRGLHLLEKKKYGAAKAQFEQVQAEQRDKQSEVSASASFYAAQCASELFHRDAEYLLRQFITAHETSYHVPDAYFLLGASAYRKKQYAEAVGYFDKIDLLATAEPRKSEVLFKSAYSNFKEGELDVAATQFRSLTDESSKYFAPGLYYFGHINYSQGKYAVALEAFDRLTEHEQFGPVVPYYIVQIHHLQQQYDDVIAFGKPFFERESTQRRPEISRLIGEAYSKRQQWIDAVPYLETFMQSNLAKAKEDYYAMAMAYYKAGRFDAAAEQFSKIAHTDDAIAQNAQYHMGEAYLKADKKSYARNAYRAASLSPHNDAIAEEALFKFALLSRDLGFDPYDGAIAAFKEYIEKYPTGERADEAFEHLVHIYLTSKNYDAALASIDGFKNPDRRLLEAYQRIAFNKGVEALAEHRFQVAVESFDRSRKYPLSAPLAAEAIYWKGEAAYQQGAYDKAIAEYQAFLVSPGAVLTPYFNAVNYNTGYAYFQQKKFIEAPEHFRRFTSVRSETDVERIADANLRLGDCYYMLRQFDAAKEFYQMAADKAKTQLDYCAYQLAMTSGFLGDATTKLSGLQKMVAEYPQSHYTDAALYEIGRTHLVLNDPEAALASLNKVVSEHAGSTYVRKALVNIGQIHYNADRNEDALAVFTRIVNEYPNYNDTREALMGIRNIYVETGRAAEFEPLVNSLSFVNFSDGARDSLAYEAADRYYLDGQWAEGAKAFSAYLERFKSPIFKLNAQFYRAECLWRTNKQAEAMVDFQAVAEAPQNTFSETALLRVSRHAFDQERYPEALAYYKRLALLGQNKGTLLEAEVGQMRCNYQLNNHMGSIANAVIVLDDDRLDANLYSEANLYVGKGNIELQTPAEGAPYLKKVVKANVPAFAAEASYLLASLEFNADRLDSAEAQIFRLVQRYQGEALWVAKSLILLSDVYLTRGDAFQAQATLQSIMDNYVPDDEVKKLATSKMADINAAEERRQKEMEVDFDIYLENADSTSN